MSVPRAVATLFVLMHDLFHRNEPLVRLCSQPQGHTPKTSSIFSIQLKPHKHLVMPVSWQKLPHELNIAIILEVLQDEWYYGIWIIGGLSKYRFSMLREMLWSLAIVSNDMQVVVIDAAHVIRRAVCLDQQAHLHCVNRYFGARRSTGARCPTSRHSTDYAKILGDIDRLGKVPALRSDKQSASRRDSKFPGLREYISVPVNEWKR
jgi:hypothetical protein